ncbi:hypothetical protein TruAng_005814 [Truncatella angustata]|nr:hypothetical protein TruAng_005814 [Truncatella angustata]
MHYPTPSDSHEFSTSCFSNGGYDNSFRALNNPNSTFSNIDESVQQNISPTTSFPSHQQQAAYQHHRQMHHQVHPGRPPFVHSNGFHSDHHSSSYSGTPQPLSAGATEEGVDAASYDSDHSQHGLYTHQFRRMSRTSDISTALSPASVLSSQVSNDNSMVFPARSKQQQQHERTRRKNRMAASKCREKSKKNTDDLRQRERELVLQKQILTACAADLRDEVLALKHEILSHASCNCEYIQNYLIAAASQVT